MRAYYATHKHIRVFVFGTPEGWHTVAYDLQRKEWLPMGGRIHDTLKDAKDARFEAMTPEEYAEHKHAQIQNPARRMRTMARAMNPTARANCQRR